MKVTIEILGPNNRQPNKNDAQYQIHVINKICESGKLSASEMHSLIQTKSILEGIKKELPKLKKATIFEKVA